MQKSIFTKDLTRSAMLMAVLSCSQAVELRSQTEAEAEQFLSTASDTLEGAIDAVEAVSDRVGDAVEAVSDGVDNSSFASKNNAENEEEAELQYELQELDKI